MPCQGLTGLHHYVLHLRVLFDGLPTGLSPHWYFRPEIEEASDHGVYL